MYGVLPLDQLVESYCDVPVHKTIPLLNIRLNKTIQYSMYILVSVWKYFYAAHPSPGTTDLSNEIRKVAGEDKRIITDETIN